MYPECYLHLKFHGMASVRVDQKEDALCTGLHGPQSNDGRHMYLSAFSTLVQSVVACQVLMLDKVSLSWQGWLAARLQKEVWRCHVD